MLFVRENFVLHRQENARAVHQVNDGNAVFHGDFLRPEVLLSCDGEPGSSLHRSIVGNGDDQPAFNVAHLHDNTTSRAAAFLFIHAFASQCPDFDGTRAGIEEAIEAFPCG